MGVRVRQPRGTEFAAQREAIRYQGAVSEALGSMSDFLYKKGVERAEQAGLERVRTEGAVPILESLKEQGGPRTIEEKTAYEAANRLAVAEIQTEAELDITKILDEGQASKTSYSAIQAKLADVADGYSAALSAIDPVSAGILRTRLTEATGKADSRYGKWWTGEQEKLRREKQNNVAANTAQAILGNAILPGQTTIEIDAEIAAGAQKLRDLGVKEQQVQDWSDQVKEGAFKNNYLFEFNQLNVDEQGAAIEQVLGGETSLPGMDYEDSVRFVNGLLRPEYNRNRSVMTSQSKYVVNKVKDQNEILESGGRVSQDVIQEMRTRASEVEEYDGGAAVQAVNELEADANLFSSFRGMSLSEMEATVRAYGEGIEGQGGEGRDTTIEVKRYEQATKFFENMQTQIAKDPMSYAERVGFIERKDIITRNEQGALQIDDVALAERSQQAQQVADYYGLPQPKMLFSDETRQLALVLEKAEGAAKLNLLGVLADFDQASGQVLTDLADYNPDLSLVGALVNVGATEAAELAVAGFDRIKAGEKAVEFTPTNIDPVYSDTFGRAVTTPRMSQAIKGVAKSIYTELAARRGVDTFDADLYEESLQLAAGYRLVNGKEYGGIQEVRGVPTFINPNLDAGAYERMLDEITPEAVAAVTGLTINPTLAASINETEAYKVRNIGGDKYVIEYGENGDVVVADTEGRPIIFNAQQMFEALIPVPVIGKQLERGEIPGKRTTTAIRLEDGTFAEVIQQDEPPSVVEQLRQAEPVTDPEVVREQARTIEPGQTARKRSRVAEQTIREQVEAGQLPPSIGETALPLLRSVPDDVSDSEYIDYMDAVFGGYKKPFKDWKASQ